MVISKGGKGDFQREKVRTCNSHFPLAYVQYAQIWKVCIFYCDFPWELGT